ncbi:MAG: hypothetical protein U9O98_09710, partial [Asgard group archaeon]|nr:hypothetical protein [Asgard group archaeon]
MDIIPKHNRGKWNSLQAIAWGLFWNISAVIGGFIVGDNNNFNLCFIITTFIYILGMVPIIILMPIVGKEREALDMENDQKVAALTRENQMKELDLADETFYKTKDKEIKEPNPNLD